MSKDIRVINLVGMAPSLSCYKPVFGEIWMCNHAWIYDINPDKWFLMDGWEAHVNSCKTLGISQEKFIKYASNFKNEILSIHDEEFFDGEKLVAKCKGLPLNNIRFLAGTYFTSSIAWMLANCAYEHKVLGKKIDLVNMYGVELWISHDKAEYYEQTDCVNFWIAYLSALGVQVNVPAYLLSAVKASNALYGY